MKHIVLFIILTSTLTINSKAYYFCKKTIGSSCRISCGYNICSNDKNACKNLSDHKKNNRHHIRRYKRNSKLLLYSAKDCKPKDYKSNKHKISKALDVFTSLKNFIG
jgi:hypothetical protein